MFKILLLLVGLVTSAPMAQAQNLYDHVIFLDAENLAEVGIKEAYDQLLPTLKQYTKNPFPVSEKLEDDNSKYSVTGGGQTYLVWDSRVEEPEYYGWFRAGFVLFDLVNRQLSDSDVHFYALYTGNDLSGIFLDHNQYLELIKTISRPYDQPWQPTPDPPNFGFHDDQLWAPFLSKLPD